MQIGMVYVDSMDTDRTLEPIDATGRSRVYYLGRYVGNADCPPSLFRLLPADAYRFGYRLKSEYDSERAVDESPMFDD